MKPVPYINCFSCGARIDGPFQPPERVPPEKCPSCGEPPTLHFEGGAADQKELLEKLAKMQPELADVIQGVLGRMERAENGELDTIDLVEKVVEAYQRAQHDLPKEQASVAVGSGTTWSLWAAWGLGSSWDKHKAILN